MIKITHGCAIVRVTKSMKPFDIAIIRTCNAIERCLFTTNSAIA